MRARFRGPVFHLRRPAWLLRRPQDTITGFLLAGVGNVDLRRKSNFLIVDQSASAQAALARRAILLCQALLRRKVLRHSLRLARDRDHSAGN